MASSFKLSFTAVLLCVAFSFCRGQGQSGGGGGGGGGAGAGAGAGGAGGGSGIGAVVPGTQDSVQIVAQAALCFDNKPVLNGCLQAMGINTSAGARPSMPSPGAQAIMCSPPCSGHVTMMMSCVNGIFGNFVSYNPGLMQGVQAVFQMSCGNGNGNGPGGAGAGGAAGGAGGPAGGAGGAGVGGAEGGVGGGVGGAAAGGMPNSVGGASGAGTGIVGGAGGGVGVGPAGGAAGAMPNQIGGAAAGGGAGAGGAAGGGGTVSSVGGAAGGASSVSGGGNDTGTGDDAVGTITSSNATNVVALPPKPSAGSHVAVSNQSQPTTSGADGPAFSLRGACASVLLVTWAGAWLPLLV